MYNCTIAVNKTEATITRARCQAVFLGYFAGVTSWHVKEILGHRSIQSTEVYIHIEKMLYNTGINDEFHVKVANTAEEIQVLLETGFEYVMSKDNLAFFRKRK